MKIITLAFEIFLLYLLYKFVFDFIIPVIKTTRQVKKQFGEMSAQMQEKMNQQQAGYKSADTNFTKADNEDYIEFEEVKK